VNLAETLVYADIKQLHQLAAAYSLTCNVHSKNELIQSLHGRLTSKSKLEEQRVSLSWEEKRFLLQVVYESRAEYTLEMLLSKARKACIDGDKGEKRTALLEHSLANGWIFRLHTGQTFKYVMPADIRSQWREIFVKEAQANAYGNYTPESFDSGVGALTDDLFTFLRYVSCHQVSLSKEGVMYRNHQQRIMSLFQVSEAFPDRKEWRFGYGRRFRDYPDRFALLYDYAHHRRLIREKPDEGLSVTEEGLRIVQQGSGQTEEILDDLFAFWMLSYRKAIPALSSLCLFIARICENNWIPESTLVPALVNWTVPFYYDKQEEIVRRRLLAMMAHLGVLYKGQNADAGNVYMLTDRGKSLLSKGTNL
jgi:hypothetical protein